MARNNWDFGNKVVGEIIIDEEMWFRVLSSELGNERRVDENSINAAIAEGCFMFHTQGGDVTIVKGPKAITITTE